MEFLEAKEIMGNKMEIENYGTCRCEIIIRW